MPWALRHSALIVTVLAVIAVALTFCNCVGCSAASPSLGGHRITTTQPVLIEQELAAIKAGVTATLAATANVQTKVTGIETNRSVTYGCDVWNDRLRTAGLIFLAATGIWLAYKVQAQRKRNGS